MDFLVFLLIVVPIGAALGFLLDANSRKSTLNPTGVETGMFSYRENELASVHSAHSMHSDK